MSIARLCAVCGESKSVMVLMRGHGTQRTPNLMPPFYLCGTHWARFGGNP